MQMDFVTELFAAASARGIHTCLDTSGITFVPDRPEVVEHFDRLIAVTNLVMLDIKHIDPAEHKKLTGQPLEPILAFARYLDEHNIPIWVRHVVVPGITYDQNELYRLGQFLGTLHSLKALDALPYHTMGKVKYDNLGIPYPLEGVRPLEKQEAIAARQVILKGIRDSRSK